MKNVAVFITGLAAGAAVLSVIVTWNSEKRNQDRYSNAERLQTCGALIETMDDFVKWARVQSNLIERDGYTDPSSHAALINKQVAIMAEVDREYLRELSDQNWRLKMLYTDMKTHAWMERYAQSETESTGYEQQYEQTSADFLKLCRREFDTN